MRACVRAGVITIYPSNATEMTAAALLFLKLRDENRTCKFNPNCPKPVQPMAPAAVEVDLGVGTGAAAGELEAGWSGERSTEVSLWL